jgi:hypothetical protein
MDELDRKLWPLVEMIEKVRVAQLRRFRTSGPILGTDAASETDEGTSLLEAAAPFAQTLVSHQINEPYLLGCHFSDLPPFRSRIKSERLPFGLLLVLVSPACQWKGARHVNQHALSVLFSFSL